MCKKTRLRPEERTPRNKSRKYRNKERHAMEGAGHKLALAMQAIARKKREEQDASSRHSETKEADSKG